MTTRNIVRIPTIIVTVVLGSGLAACGDDGAESSPAAPAQAAPVIDPGDGGDYAPVIDPADFVATVDNPYFPLPPGARWEYNDVSDGETEHVTVAVTDERRLVMGVSTVVVRDTVTVDGEVVEDTFDWFAQDRDGNVWYFGEAVQNFDAGRLESTDGSWEAGVDGALPGIVMPATPTVGRAYRQEYYPDEAEDLGEILRTGERRTVAFGAFDDVLVTRDWNPLEPDIIEEKSYAPGVGLIYETKVAGEEGSVELVDFVVGGVEA